MLAVRLRTVNLAVGVASVKVARARVAVTLVAVRVSGSGVCAVREVAGTGPDEGKVPGEEVGAGPQDGKGPSEGKGYSVTAEMGCACMQWRVAGRRLSEWSGRMSGSRDRTSAASLVFPGM